MDATHDPEEWRPVVGYEGAYEVSNRGRVRSIDRVTLFKDGRRRYFAGRILKPRPTPTGYLRTVDFYVHRAVLMAFVGPCPDGMEACHNDSDRSNNSVENLRWDTRYGNCQDIKALGSHANTQKLTCPNGHPYDAVVHGPAMRAQGLGPRRYCTRCRNERARLRYIPKSERRSA